MLSGRCRLRSRRARAAGAGALGWWCGTLVCLVLLASCGARPSDQAAPPTVDTTISSTTTSDSTTSTTSTTVSQTSTTAVPTYDFEVPTRISPLPISAEEAISLWLVKVRSAGVTTPTDQEIVDAGVAVCSYFDLDGPDAAMNSSVLVFMVFVSLGLVESSSVEEEPIYPVLDGMLVDFKADTSADRAVEALGQLDVGAAVLFCPEHKPPVSG